MPTHSSHTTVTVTNPDGTTTTTKTHTVKKTHTVETTETIGGVDEVGTSPDETGPYDASDDPVEKVILGTVLEGVEILQKGAEYVRRVSKIAGLFLAKKD